MATHFSILAWKVPWTEEPGRPFGGPKRVEHNLMTERACSVWKLQNITKQCQLDEAYLPLWLGNV